MKKNLILLLFMILVVAGLFTSCDDNQMYTVRFKGVKDLGPNEVQVPNGGKVEEPKLTNSQENSNPGFAFYGWTLDGDDYDFNSPVTRDLVLVAKWSHQCKVTFNTGEGGSKVESQAVAYYAEVKEPDAPTKRGYTFSCWQQATDEGPVQYNFDKPVYESFELTAVWEAKEITVKYVVTPQTQDIELGRDDPEPESQKYKAGTEIKIKDFPSSTDELHQAGKAFVGWSFNGITYHAGDKITVQANNPNNPEATNSDEVMTLTAVWKDDYNVGDTGPSGGLIVYKAATIQTTNYTDKNGNEVEYKWQYIESAPAPLTGSYCFGYNLEGSSATPATIVVNSTAIGTGLLNTRAVVNKLGDSAYLKEDGTAVTYTYKDKGGVDQTTSPVTKGVYAAKACEDYEIKNSNNMTYNDWILPSKADFEEFFVAYRTSASNRKKFVTGSYITSSEASATNCYTVVATAQEVEGFDFIVFNYQFYETARSELQSIWPVRYF